MNYPSLTTSLEGNWWVLKIKDKGKRIKVGGAGMGKRCRRQDAGCKRMAGGFCGGIEMLTEYFTKER